MTATAPAAQRKGHGRAATLAAIARDARLSRGYLMQMALATAIATLGLLMDSPPVIIGAMLISPLLAPIMGFGFALATFDGRLLRRSLQTLGAGTLVGIAVAAVLVALSPITDATPSLLSRVRPSLLDLFVAVFGGVAGAYALLRRNSTGLVGVAIATALVPPLATAGWGIVQGRFDDAAGALLLFVTNTAAIGFMATAVARYNAFGANLSPKQSRVQTAGIVTALAVLAIPLWFSLSAVVREARVTSMLRQELVALGGDAATIDRLDIAIDGSQPSVSAVVIAPAFVPALEKRFAATVRRELGDTAVARVIQLRSGSSEAEAARTAAARAERAREVTASEAQRLRAALALAYAVEPATILIDTERRRALVTRPEEQLAPATRRAPAVEPVPDTASAPLRAAFPDWKIEMRRVSPPASIGDGDGLGDRTATTARGSFPR